LKQFIYHPKIFEGKKNRRKRKKYALVQIIKDVVWTLLIFTVLTYSIGLINDSFKYHSAKKQWTTVADKKRQIVTKKATVNDVKYNYIRQTDLAPYQKAVNTTKTLIKKANDYGSDSDIDENSVKNSLNRYADSFLISDQRSPLVNSTLPAPDSKVLVATDNNNVSEIRLIVLSISKQTFNQIAWEVTYNSKTDKVTAINEYKNGTSTLTQ
jgi:hypothetical protein